jgi:hypothetical protein
LPLPVTAYAERQSVSTGPKSRMVCFLTYLDDDIFVAAEEVESGLLDRSGLLIAH